MLASALVSVGFRGFGALALLILNFVVVRELSEDGAAKFFLLVSFCLLSAQLLCFGIEYRNLKYFSILGRDGEESKRWNLASILSVCFVIFCFSIVFLPLSGWLANILYPAGGFSEYLLVAPLLIFFLAVSRVFSFNLQSIGRVVSSVSVLSIVAPAVAILIILLFPNPDSGLVAYSVGTFSALVLGLLLWGVDYRLIKDLLGDRAVFADVFNSSRPLWVSSSLSILMQMFGVFVVGMNSSPEDVAGYSVALRIANLVSLILIGVNMIVSPKFAHAYAADDINEIEKVSKFAARFCVSFALPILFFIVVFSKYIMSMFSPDLEDYSTLLIILALGQAVNVISGSVGYILNMAGGERVLRNIIIIIAPASVASSFLAGNMWGVSGVAVVTAASISVYNLCAVYAVWRRLGFFTLNIW